MLRFLLSGYYGFGNLGDEALLQLIVHTLRERRPLAEVEVLSADPEATRHELRVDATPRADMGAVRKAIERADVVLSGGGGLLQNATSLRSLIYYAGIIRTAIKAGKKTMIFAQSIGPLDFVGRQTVKECCKGLAAATVRDERSRALLAPLLPGLTVERTADPVFLYRPDEQRPAPAGIASGDAPLVVVCVRPMARFDAVLPRLVAAIDHAAQRYGACVAFVPFSSPEDADASTRVIQKCASRPMLLPLSGLADVAGVLARAHLVIGVRLHALILATRLGIPFVHVPYDPKVAGLCEDLAYPLAPLWTPDGRGAGEPVAVIDEAWSRHAELRELLLAGASRMETLAGRNFDAIDRLLGAGVPASGPS